MASVNGAAKFKLKNGLLSIFENSNPPMLRWIATDLAVAKVEIPLRTLNNVQASLATSEKLLIRIQHQNAGDAEAQKTVFSFTNKMIMETFRNALKQILERQKASQEVTKQAKNLHLQVSQTKDSLEEILDPVKLLNHAELQQRLLTSEPKLKKLFTEAVIRNGLDPQEFWKTRLQLLGTFALKDKAKRGPYNVLSTIALVATSDNKVNINVTREKIQSIFDQYPIVRKAYEDNVPRIPEGEFWNRFFTSKLFRKLKGEIPSKNEKGDMILDNYLKLTDDEIQQMDDDDRKKKLQEKGEYDPEVNMNQVSRLYDVEGNDEDNSQKLGNLPDFTMKPQNDRQVVSIMKGYNRLSKKLVEDVEDEENYKRAKIRKLNPEEEVNEETRELLIKDLEPSAEADFQELMVRKTNEIQNNGIFNDTNDADLVTMIDDMKTYFPHNGSVELASVYSAKDSIDAANREIYTMVINNARRPKQIWQISNSTQRAAPAVVELLAVPQSTSQMDQAGAFEKVKLKAESIETLRLVHITSEEFLKHFWLHFNSGDPAQANTTRKLYMSVNKCVQRIHAAIESVSESENDVNTKEIAKSLLKPISRSLNEARKQYINAQKALET